MPKYIVITIIAMTLLVGGGIYLTKPAYGEEIASPSGLKSSIDSYFAKTNHRAVDKMKVFYCSSTFSLEDIYVVEISLVVGNLDAKTPEQIGEQYFRKAVLDRFWKVRAITGANSEWQLIASSIYLPEGTPMPAPCDLR